MAQLKEDEWPADGEPTTSEEEVDSFKRHSVSPRPAEPDRPVSERARDPECGTGDSNQPISSRRP
jgi:hypothetical protein